MNALQTCAIIPYTAKHLEDVSQMDKRCLIDPWFKQAFTKELSAPCGLNLIAVSHDSARTLGNCLTRIITDECTLNRLAVHPDYQCSGIATRLLKQACTARAVKEPARFLLMYTPATRQHVVFMKNMDSNVLEHETAITK